MFKLFFLVNSTSPFSKSKRKTPFSQRQPIFHETNSSYLGKVEICQLLHALTLLGEGCNLGVWVSDKLLKKNSHNQSLSKYKINYGPLLWSGASPSSQTELSAPSPWKEPGTRPLCCLVSEREKNISQANFLWMQCLEQMSCCPLGNELWTEEWHASSFSSVLDSTQYSQIHPQGLASHCKAKTTLTFHFSIINA